jgi:hypothetical protein
MTHAKAWCLINTRKHLSINDPAARVSTIIIGLPVLSAALGDEVLAFRLGLQIGSH